MNRTLVAYGPATRNPDGYEASKQERDLKSWADAHRSSILVWRREGRSTLTKPIELRTRLHQALFCIRANFADDLWMPSWPSTWGAWDEALICAVLAPYGGRLTVDGSQRRPETTDPYVRDARTWMSLLERLDPRKMDSDGPDDPADIGAHLGAQEAARLAIKLKDDFGLTDSEIAAWLEEHDYESRHGTPYTAGGLHHLLTGPPISVDIERTSLHDPSPRHSGIAPRLAVATFGIDADRLVDRAQQWDSRQPHPTGVVAPVPGESSDPGADLGDRADLVTLLALSPVLSAVYLGSGKSLATRPQDRAFLFALLEHHGVTVIVDDEPTTGACRSEDSVLDYGRARSAIQLHQQLRAHDVGTVDDPDLSLTKAYELAQSLRDQQLRRTLELIAGHLNEEGIPTRRGTGQWWAASVRGLLERGPQ